MERGTGNTLMTRRVAPKPARTFAKSFRSVIALAGAALNTLLGWWWCEIRTPP